MKRKITLLLTAISFAITFAGCQQTDVIGNASVKSFKALLSAPSIKVTENANHGWDLTAPDGAEKFTWGNDFDAANDDASIEFDARPFINAGLDEEKLPKEMVAGDKLRIAVNFGGEKPGKQAVKTAISSFEQIVRFHRERMKYHADLDHFGVNLGGGNVFEWAKDMSKNDKDMVFVLNPQPFVDAGTDPQKVDGWVFAKVKTMDSTGKPMEVEKLLKPFNLIP